MVIVVIAIAVVTAHFGPTSNAELEAREERMEQPIELREEALERRVKREQRSAEGEALAADRLFGDVPDPRPVPLGEVARAALRPSDQG